MVSVFLFHTELRDIAGRIGGCLYGRGEKMFHFLKTRKSGHGKADPERRFLRGRQDREQPQAPASDPEAGQSGSYPEQIRDEYREYYSLLENYLKDRGIKLKPVYTAAADAQPLANHEYAVYLFDVGDQVFALPGGDIGIERGLWRMDSDQAVCHPALRHRVLLATGTDGQMIYALTGKGTLPVIDPEDGDDKCCVTENAQIIDPLAYCRKEAEKIFSEKQMADEFTRLCSRERVEQEIIRLPIAVHDPNASYLVNDILYDTAKQHFFRIAIDGNFYHGYGIDYYPMSRESAGQVRLCIGTVWRIFHLSNARKKYRC